MTSNFIRCNLILCLSSERILIMKTRIRRLLILVIAPLLLAAGWAQEQDDKAAIKERMKERYPMVQKAKNNSKIGETNLGYLEIVAAKDTTNELLVALVKAENSDRQEIYDAIAKNLKTSPEVVAKQNALRLFEKADLDDLFKGEDGKWLLKKDLIKKEKKE